MARLIDNADYEVGATAENPWVHLYFIQLASEMTSDIALSGHLFFILAHLPGQPRRVDRQRKQSPHLEPEAT
ncbi:unnamed protein product [Protopolystoma xenopodis]|uniref:Uncharacterized protein n=1 Tax=Protopolystoma xenopodis TaxID=117903 RepID=A0A448WDE2_9PLAT|nr:unnamed protein product [Protopolystoma xenopodis]